MACEIEAVESILGTVKNRIPYCVLCDMFKSVIIDF